MKKLLLTLFCMVMTMTISAFDGTIYFWNTKDWSNELGYQLFNDNTPIGDKIVINDETPTVDNDYSNGYTVYKIDINNDESTHVQFYGDGTSSNIFELIDGKYYDCSSGIYTGIENITTTDKVEYYNIHGVKVNNPENGIYIVKKNGRVTKKIVR